MAVDARLTVVDTETGSPRPLETSDLGGPAPGTFGYAAGVGPDVVDVPPTSSVRRISIVASDTDATVTIGAGDAITVPAFGGFDEDIVGADLGVDVTIAGGVASFYVSWGG